MRKADLGKRIMDVKSVGEWHACGDAKNEATSVVFGLRDHLVLAVSSFRIFRARQHDFSPWRS